MLGLGFAGALAAAGPGAAKAEGFYFSTPGVEVDVGPRYRDPYRHRYYGERPYRHYGDAYAYSPRRGYGRYGTWNGCPPRYTIQDGVCKPYRGY
jgi:hypothetical protein